VQIGAISEDQTDNTWSVIHHLLTENDGKAADALGIDAGLTRCFLRGQPGAKMEPVTSAAGSREGQPLTYGVLDESHLMLPSNGGVKLARTIRRNVAKMSGRSYETTNSFIRGQHSVAEESYNAVRSGSPGIYADEVEAPMVVDGVPVNEMAPDEILAKALRVAYGDSWWVEIDRLVADMRDPANRWIDSAKYFLNWNMDDDGYESPIDLARWKRTARDGGCLDTDSSASSGHAALSVAPGSTSAAVAFAGFRDDDLLHMDIQRHEVGTGWVVAACKRAFEDTGNPVVVNPKAATAGVLKALDEAGVPVREVTATEYAEGCQALQREVLEGQVRHRGQPELDLALTRAATRSVGQVWSWDGLRSEVDICTVEAVTLAAIAARESVSYVDAY
jgi:hypothetical protein